MSMRILHILDHSAPLHSGYTFRTLEILRQQRKPGWQTIHLTSAKQGLYSPDAAPGQEIDGRHFFRTAPLRQWWARLPVLRHTPPDALLVGDGPQEDELKALEALAQGRLIVASDVGGHREMIEHGKTGMLFQAGDANALADGVIGLVRQVQAWPRLRAQARAYVGNERNWRGSVARYRAIYQRLAAPRT